MKNIGEFKENLILALEVPKDVAGGETIVTFLGPNLVMIENYRSIVAYTEQEMRIQTKKGRIRICGSGLVIPAYTKEEMQVRGRIASVFWEK